MDLYFLELFFSGLTRGGIYTLIALGYTMVYGIIGLINFAHGEIYMIAAFIGLTFAGIFSILQFSLISILLIAVFFAMLFSAAYGYTIEKTAYKPLRQASRLAPLISAIGMSIFLREYVILAQTPDFLAFPMLFGDLELPEFMMDFIQPTETIIILVSFFLVGILLLFIKHTKTGKAMRAISQDREMAMLLGVNSDKIISFTFMVGSLLAAFGAILISAHIGQINYNIGFIIGIKAFTAAVLGGIGSIPGAALGGLTLGLIESFATGYISSDYEDVFAFGILVLILIFKPAGFLGKKEHKKV
ncbi:MAG: branched-chain amino acid ABC transporter permease LivH [Deltaproteobacteria bacterium]|nr:branched-chain amino acid ABC transporter permease LivH [Deltaproteobacteria bacterium]